MQTTHQHPMQIVVTRNVIDKLQQQELHAAVTQLREKMKHPDPDNPNLWTVEIAGHTIWGILDEGAGTNGEDLFTVLLPNEY